MKRLFVIALFLIFFITPVYSEGPKLLEWRNQFFEEANALRALLATSNDPGVIINMWNSCMTTILQLNAYFYMLSIFDAIKTEFLSEDPTPYLMMWLNEIKKTNALNIKNLSASSKGREPKTKEHLERLKDYYNKLNSLIDTEMDKISLIQNTLIIRKKR